MDEPLQLQQEVSVLWAVLQVEVKHGQLRDGLHGSLSWFQDLIVKEYLRMNVDRSDSDWDESLAEQKNPSSADLLLK